MMTRNQKIEWLASASSEELLKQYEASVKAANDPFGYSKLYGCSVEEVLEDYDLAKAELLKRMSR